MRRIDRILWPVASRTVGYLLLLALTPVMAILTGVLAESIHNGALQTAIMIVTLVGSVVWSFAVTGSHARFLEFKEQARQDLARQEESPPMRCTTFVNQWGFRVTIHSHVGDGRECSPEHVTDPDENYRVETLAKRHRGRK